MNLKDVGYAIDASLQEEYKDWIEKISECARIIEEQDAILRSDEAQGDRSENAVFINAVDAKQEASHNKSVLQEKINKFDTTFNIYKTTEHEPSNVVQVGSVVRFTIIEDNKEFTVKIVPKEAAAPLKDAISDTSAAGSALLNKRVGDIVRCQSERKTWSFKIQEVY